MHIIRSQAFANLWTKALKAHHEGLAVVRAMGTEHWLRREGFAPRQFWTGPGR
ncbi:hypothetical protein [Streptomyces sp. NPDC058280]|uniref:hypothetical protein n=1 Tax=Streptomyces sp. NPDC058280 TaxID=3346419 RepID=UPI0036DFCD21